MNEIICPLCSSASKTFCNVKEKIYLRCSNCDAIYLDPKFYLTENEEKKRYEYHENDINDLGYRNFLSPVLDGVCEGFSPSTRGLDFGAGIGPVVAQMLKEKGYQVDLYDLYFWIDKKVLEEKYDFVVCTEVIEHFKNPSKEFALFKKLLKTKSKLFLMTDIFADDKNFNDWYYKNDPTHIFFYTQKTFEKIAEIFKLSLTKIKGRLIVYENI